MEGVVHGLHHPHSTSSGQPLDCTLPSPSGSSMLRSGTRFALSGSGFGALIKTHTGSLSVRNEVTVVEGQCRPWPTPSIKSQPSNLNHNTKGQQCRPFVFVWFINIEFGKTMSFGISRFLPCRWRQ
jgi:hypothetical protein